MTKTGTHQDNGHLRKENRELIDDENKCPECSGSGNDGTSEDPDYDWCHECGGTGKLYDEGSLK